MYRRGVQVTIVLFILVQLLLAQMNGMKASNIVSHFVDDAGKTCNVYDDASFCKMVIIDSHLALIAVNQRCECPRGYRCPNDPQNTVISPRCQFLAEKKVWSCAMPCVPMESFDRYPKQQ